MNQDILALIQENMNTFSKGQKRIAAYGVRRRFRQVRRHNAVVIGSRRLNHQPL